MTTGRSYTFVFRILFLLRYKKGSGNIARHSCFRSHRQKARAKWESRGSLLQRVSTSECKFLLRNNAHTQRQSWRRGKPGKEAEKASHKRDSEGVVQEYDLSVRETIGPS
jgi:hypothetical protein